MARKPPPGGFWALDPFDKSRCSFPVPDFKSGKGERVWSASLTVEQRFELLRWMQVFRWGEAAVNRPMGKSKFRSMTMAEFDTMKESEAVADDKWRMARGIPLKLWRRK